jgi:hypothetical protein
MLRALQVYLGKGISLLCCPIVLGLAASVRADPKPLTKEEQAKVDKAIDKGVAYLKRTQTKEGDWPRQWPKGYLMGQCALPAYALLEAGVAPDDPVIQKAADFLRPKALKTDRTYELSLAILFFDRLGDPKDKKLIQSLALRLIAGQHRTGGWSYRCLTLSERNEAALLQSLERLSKHIKEGGKLNREALRTLEVPRALGPLTVFQEPEKLDWEEQGSANQQESRSLVQGTDNSNTQFAMLGLWVAQRHAIPMEPTFRIMVERFERTQFTDGWWPYEGIPRRERHHSPAMICAGLLGLSIGRGLNLPTPGAVAPEQQSMRILRGLAALYKEIGVPTGQMKQTVPLHNLYFLWSLERVGMLYNLPTIGDKDWYRWGAEILVTNQKSSGGWTGLPPSDYGVPISTAFALLFLKRVHPMKDLTRKLPFKAKELNQGVALLLSGAPPLEPSTATPSRSDKPKR